MLFSRVCRKTRTGCPLSRSFNRVRGYDFKEGEVIYGRSCQGDPLGSTHTTGAAEAVGTHGPTLGDKRRNPDYPGV